MRRCYWSCDQPATFRARPRRGGPILVCDQHADVEARMGASLKPLDLPRSGDTIPQEGAT